MCTYRDQFIQIWHASLECEQSLTGQGGNKLRSYRLFKKDFVLEPYLLNITSTALQVSMTRLRVGCHSLEIERGRHHKPHSLPVSRRLCSKCKSVEDEIHFLCECTRYKWKNHFVEMKGDVGMSVHEKGGKQVLHQHTRPFITPSLHLCEKLCFVIEYEIHKPLTVLQHGMWFCVWGSYYNSIRGV